MKRFIPLSLILLVTSVWSQDYREAFKADICNCIQDEQATYKNLFTTYQKCFDDNLVNHADAIDAEVANENTTKIYLRGQQLRADLLKKFKHELVYSCDYYYQTIEQYRARLLELTKIGIEDPQKLEKINYQIAHTPNSNSYFERAKYYVNIGKMDLAEADYKKALELTNPRNSYAAGIYKSLGWLTEYQNRYAEALEYYQKLSDYESNKRILIAIINRKSNGNVPSSPLETQKSNKVTTLPAVTELQTKKEITPTPTPNNNTKPSESKVRDLFKLD